MSKKLISAILLSGGRGLRSKSTTPKQYLHIDPYPIAVHSMLKLSQSGHFHELIVVCASEYRPLFTKYHSKLQLSTPLLFADAGARRQDSLWNGVQAISSSEWICIHDAARPLFATQDLVTLISNGIKYGASVIGVPSSSTLKEKTEDHFVKRTLDRSSIWEIQTPQFLNKKILLKGFSLAKDKNLEVTDDVAFAELANCKIKLVEGSAFNFKITTPTDLVLAKNLQGLIHA